MTPAVQAWLTLWNQWQYMLLDSGVAHPSPQAEDCLAKWITAGQNAGWDEASRLGRRLMNASVSLEEKTEAFLKLCVLYEAVRNQVECEQLKENYKHKNADQEISHGE